MSRGKRLAVLERRLRPADPAYWAGRPVGEWSDEALIAVIAQATGIAPDLLCDDNPASAETLQAIADGTLEVVE